MRLTTFMFIFSFLVLLWAVVVMAAELPHPMTENTLLGYSIQHPPDDNTTAVLIVRMICPVLKDGNHWRRHSLHKAPTHKEADALAIEAFLKWKDKVLAEKVPPNSRA